MLLDAFVISACFNLISQCLFFYFHVLPCFVSCFSLLIALLAFEIAFVLIVVVTYLYV